MMITPSDEDYKSSKQIKLGKRTLHPDFVPLAEWINSEFGAQVLNITYDFITNDPTHPRLTIIFEFERDELKFRNNHLGNFDTEKQKAIAQKFHELVDQQRTMATMAAGKYNTKNVWVVSTSFEPIARDEANSLVSEAEVRKLKDDLHNKDLWEISRAFSSTTFFLYTDAQVKKYENSETCKLWTQQYFDILNRYNEFGYFNVESFFIRLDSKENFDKNYNSNWYYYYK